MSRNVRYLLFLISAVQLFFAAAFFFQWPLAVSLWPFAGTTPLTFVLIASFFAAAGASTLWPLLTGNEGALAGVALDYLFIFTPMAIYILWSALRGGVFYLRLAAAELGQRRRPIGRVPGL